VWCPKCIPLLPYVWTGSPLGAVDGKPHWGVEVRVPVEGTAAGYAREGLSGALALLERTGGCWHAHEELTGGLFGQGECRHGRLLCVRGSGNEGLMQWLRTNTLSPKTLLALQSLSLLCSQLCGCHPRAPIDASG
jgi:hypothetical protein